MPPVGGPARALRWVTALRRLLHAVFGRLDRQHEPLWPLMRVVDVAYAELVAAPLPWTTLDLRSNELTLEMEVGEHDTAGRREPPRHAVG